MDGLFRPEVIEHRNDRLHGAVVISQSISSQVLTGAIVLICSALIIWLALGTFARIETAQGMLVTDKPSPKISAILAGVITDLPVGEGAIVKKGDRLAVITVEQRAEDGNASASAGIASIDARLSLNDQQRRVQRRKRISEQVRLRSVIAATGTAVAGLDSEIRLQQQVVAASKDLFDRAQEAIGRGFVSKVELESRREHMIQAQQGLANLQQQRLAQLKQGEQERVELAEIENEIAGDTIDIASGRQVLEQQRAELAGARSYVLFAPTAGRVTALRSTVGNAVAAGTPLMSIVPQAATLRAEAYVPSRAIGFVRAGQEVRLEYDAFPYQRFGSAKGAIASVSRIIIDPRETLIPVKVEEPVYKVEIALEQQSVLAFGARYPLQPGMALQANLVLERQSFLDWLLTPLRAVRNRT